MHQHSNIPMTARDSRGGRALLTWTALAAAAFLLSSPVLAQNFPITPGQRSTAQQVAQAGIPLSELAPNAPDEYTVKRGDTLWAISGMFLKSAWRWPELWGMNMEEVRNPHRIYPGQHLMLEKVDGLARLRVRSAQGEVPTETIRVSPRTRVEALTGDASLPTLQTHLIEPFLAEPIIIDDADVVIDDCAVGGRRQRFHSGPSKGHQRHLGRPEHAEGTAMFEGGIGGRNQVVRNGRAAAAPATIAMRWVGSSVGPRKPARRSTRPQPVMIRVGCKSSTIRKASRNRACSCNRSSAPIVASMQCSSSCGAGVTPTSTATRSARSHRSLRSPALHSISPSLRPRQPRRASHVPRCRVSRRRPPR